MSVKTFTLNCPVCGGPMRRPPNETADGAMSSAAPLDWIAGCRVHGMFRLGPARDVPVVPPIWTVRHHAQAVGPTLPRRSGPRKFFGGSARAMRRRRSLSKPTNASFCTDSRGHAQEATD